VPGGFIGVDVFFVISGFLISGIVFKQLERDRFSFADFYARRIRRIFPALIVTLIGCAAIGWYVLTGAEFRQLQKHIAAGSLFVSNFALWGEAGYFDARSEVKPLLHLWSLAIEEQFYLIWPPLLYVCWKRGLNVLTVIITIVVASFAWNVLLVGVSAAGAFYWPTTRMWELLFGALLAYIDAFRREPVDRAVNRLVFASHARHDARFIANAKAAIGLVLVLVAATMLGKNLANPGWWFQSQWLRDLAAVTRLDQGNLYPGWWALLPTLGTGLIIWAGADAWTNRVVLQRRALVYIGLMSYPLYLWHWPLLSFAQITEIGAPSRTLKLAALAAAATLAWLTYELVERPVRRGMSVRTPARIVAVAAILMAIGGASLYAYNSGRWTSRTPSFPTDTAGMLLGPRTDGACMARFPAAQTEYCQIYQDRLRLTTTLVGDSHAGHFVAGIGDALATRGETVAYLGHSGCPPLLDIVKIVPGARDECRASNASVLEVVSAASAPTRVVLSFRGAYDVVGTGVMSTDAPGYPAAFQLAGTAFNSGDSIKRALQSTIEMLQQRGKRVWIFEQIPEMDFDVAECIGRPFSFERHVRERCAIPRAAVDARQAPYRAIVADVARAIPSLRVFDPMPFLCDDAYCYAVRDGRLLYGDNNHLNVDGSRWIGGKLALD